MTSYAYAIDGSRIENWKTEEFYGRLLGEKEEEDFMKKVENRSKLACFVSSYGPTVSICTGLIAFVILFLNFVNPIVAQNATNTANIASIAKSQEVISSNINTMNTSIHNLELKVNTLEVKDFSKKK